MSSLTIVPQNPFVTQSHHDDVEDVTNQNESCQDADALLDQNKSSCLPCVGLSVSALLSLSALALFIINCCVLSGAAHLSSQTLGALNLSLPAFGFVSSLAAFAVTKNKLYLVSTIASAAFVAVFALGLPNPSILSARTIAWINVVPNIAVIGLSVLSGICVGAVACCCASALKGGCR